MKKGIQSLDELKRAIEDALDGILETNVTAAVRETELKKIEENVYSVYSPNVYERRESRGGLGDGDNIKGSASKGTLTVVNTTPPNPNARDGATTDKNLIEVIETGHGYDYDNPGPRPFIEPTIKALIDSKACQKALVEGLANRGFKVVMK